MPFHSPEFLVLCLLTFGLYYCGGSRFQHGVLLVASLAFYYYAGLIDTLLLLSVVALNFLASRFVESRSRGALVFALCANLGVLAYFKYRGMLSFWGHEIFGFAAGSTSVVIPLGISFYVFQLIGYQVDLFRGHLSRENSFLRMLLYILFFPHHQAGPIMRPAKFLPQFYGEKAFDANLVATGGLWIAWGLAKKVLADNLASGVDDGFEHYRDLSSAAAAWSLALQYALQIYGDFSGYSDIAMGLGYLFGYQLDRNFDQPYLATDPSEFWRRWHITLSAWLRDYLYIPLGGNRLGSLRTHVNLLLTMVLGGLWHGASAMFILWGFVHGLLLVVHRALPGLFRFKPLGWAITFGFTVVAWVPFRAESWDAATKMLGAMFGVRGLGGVKQGLVALAFLVLLVITQLLEDRVLHTERAREAWGARWLRIPGFLRGATLAGALLVVVCFIVDRTTYIYFRF